MKKVGINLVEVKEYNRALIMQLICTNETPTRNFLARKSSLTKMTLTNITTELIQKGFVEETESSNPEKLKQAKSGRSPKSLVLAPDSPIVAGIWISKDFLYGIITDLRLNTITASRVDFGDNETSKTVIEKLIELCRHLVNYSDRRILGIGIATIGIIDSQKGVLEKVINFFDVKSLKLKEMLEKEFELPVFVKNDMQSSAICEMYFGYGKDKDNFIYLGLANGVGAAAVTGRKLLNSTTGSFGEFGHLSIDYNGPLCNCGSRGCLELYAGCSNIIATINEACNSSFHSFRETMEYSELNADAGNALNLIMQKLAFGLNSMINILDIHDIIIGHSGYFLTKQAETSLYDNLNEISLFRDHREINIIKSGFMTNSPLFGSACIVLDKLFNGQIQI